MINRELNNAYKKINTWYGKKTKVLNIITRPFNSVVIFSNIITKVLRENGNVLYVFGQNEMKNIKKKQVEYIGELVDGNLEDIYLKNISFISVDKIKDVQSEFDLVIFDDITVLSNITEDKLRDAVEEIYWKCRKIIIYSFEKAFPIGEKMDLVYLKSNTPIIEPRFISTRLKLEEDIPLVLYEYLKWFKENKRVVVIFTPCEEKLNKVYTHYYYTLKPENMRVVKYQKGQNFNFIKEILDESNDSLFIVTNNIDEYIRSIDYLNIIVLFADHSYFSYKKLVYLCASLIINNNIISEVIFVSKDISNDMENVKSITRGFNKKLWEKKLLKV